MNKKEKDILKMRNYKYGCRVEIPSLKVRCAYRSFELSRVIQHEKVHWKWIANAPKSNKVRFYEVYGDLAAMSADEEHMSTGSLSLPKKDAPVRFLESNARTIHHMQHDHPEESESLSITQNEIDSCVSSSVDPQEEPIGQAEETIEPLYENAMCVSEFLETPRKGPIVNNDPNLMETAFHSPL